MIPALGLTSWYSLMHGALAPETLIRGVHEAGYTVCAVTDENNLYGLPALIECAALYGITLIPGVRFGKAVRMKDNAEKSRFTSSSPGDTVSGEHESACAQVIAHEVLAADIGISLDCAVPEEEGVLYVWPLDRDGFGRLCAIITARLCTECNLLTAILMNTGGTLAFAGTSLDMLKQLKTHGEQRVYHALETGMPFYAQAQAAMQAGISCLAIVRGSWLDVRDRDRLRLLTAVERRCRVRDLPEDTEIQAQQLPTAHEALAAFSAFPEAVQEAERLAHEALRAQECISAVPIFPAYRAQTDDESFETLKRRCIAAIPARYAGPCPRVHERLDYELRIIKQKGFAAYFLVVQDIVALCPRTCGRGSAASSIVSYLLGITHIDPLAHDLFFERFLNEARTDPPDIDVDFPWDERHGVLMKVFEQYRNHVGMVADHCTFSLRSAVREAALALGYTLLQTSALVEQYWYRKKLPEDVRYAAALLIDVPHYIGTHPGGIVITPRPITYYTHVQSSRLGFPVIAWEKDGTEQAGLVKIDILGNRSLAVLRDCIAAVSTQSSAVSGPAISWNDNTVLADSSSQELIRSGKTIGIFYIESPATRQLLAKMQTGDFENLVIASSIIRPAANRYINEFVDRLHGKSWKKLPQTVEEVLKESRGIMVYQEDVSRVAIAAAGFTHAQADKLRKVLAKKRGVLEAYRTQFFAGCRRNGITAQDTEALWAMIESFKGYSFCKAHSASYALISYQLAWMKAHYPGVFMCAVINNGGGFYSGMTYIEEARRLGYTVLPPSVQHSDVQYTVCGNTIRAGLMQIGLVDGALWPLIVRTRKEAGPFKDFLDFLGRLNPSYETCRVLVRSGACDDIAFIYERFETLFSAGKSYAINRPLMLWVYYQWKRHHGDAGAVIHALPSLLASGIAEYTRSVKLKDELFMLGVLVSTSLAELFYQRAVQYHAHHALLPFIESDALYQYEGAAVSLLGLKITGKEVTAATGDMMSFYSFMDTKGIYETVLFPDIYKKYREIMGLYTAFMVCGTVSCNRGAWSVTVTDIQVLSRVHTSQYI